MEPDLVLVIGLVLVAFSIPSMMSAISDGRAPRASALTILIAGGLVLYALRSQPGGYTMAEIPEVFVRVFATYVN